MMERGKRMARQKSQEFSKRLIADIRLLLWAVTPGGLLLAVPEKRLEQAFGLLAEQGEGAWLVGEVLPERLDGKVLEIR